jgi:hypothetical protein
VYLNSAVLDACAVMLALVPFAYLVRMCVLRAVDVPVWDAFEMVPRLDHLYSGTLTFTDLWGQHTQNRPLIPVAVMLSLARLTRWNTNWEIPVNVIVGAGIFGVFWASLRAAWHAHGGTPRWLLPLVSVLVFSPVQWENWVWGFQMGFLMCVLATLLASYLIATSSSRGGFAGAIACAVCATYCFSGGLAAWPVLAIGIVLAGGPHRTGRLALWLAAAAITYASYFYDFHLPPQPSMASNFASFAAARAFVVYVVTCLGYPVVTYDRVVAAAAGMAVLSAFAALAFRLRALRQDGAYLFPLLAGGQAIATAIMCALGRAGMNIDLALSSRYTTFTLPLWCAVAALAVLWRRSRPEPRVPILTAVTVSLLLVMLASAVASTREVVYIVAGRSEMLRFARRGLISGRSNTLLLLLYPNVDVIRERRAVLERLRISVFRPKEAHEPGGPEPR